MTLGYDIAIVGGGIVGLATANALLDAKPDRRIVVLEAETRLATHQTGHNSGVIHSGLYYKPGSLKARFCAEGREAMYRFCGDHGIAHEGVGRLSRLRVSHIGRLAHADDGGVHKHRPPRLVGRYSIGLVEADKPQC